MSETTTHVIRYSKEVMIGLHDSPLVQKPENMPLLSTWFGDDSPMTTNKSILNGAITSRTSSDKSIILGPTKTNFASSLYGGLKEKNNLLSQQQHQQQSRQQHHHHRQLDNNNNNSNNTSIKEYRSPRGPSFMGEKGFSGNNNSSQTKKYNNASSPPLPQQQNKRFDLKANNRVSNNNTRYQHKYEETERIPEWMDYSPEDDEIIQIRKEQEQVDDSIQAQFTNDLEAWKSNMKKRDGIPIIATPPVVENNKPITKDMNPMNVMNGLEIHRENSNKGGSRFAKFFAKREQEEEPIIAAMENTHISVQQQPQQARSISLDDLFQKQSTIMPSQQQQQPMPPQQQQQPMNQQGVKVFSEQDILKSLGANNKVEKNEDAMGFNRVLQILSQPKPSSPRQPQEKEKLSPSPNANRLSSNLPTSVLRQMSSRSSNSPSPSSLKATIQPQQQQQQQQLPPHHQLSPQPPYYNNGYASPPPAANTNMLTFEQLVQLNNGMPPVLPPHLRNNMMIPPPSNGRPPVPPVHMQHMMNPLHLQQLQMQQGRFPPPPPMQQLMNNGNSGMNQQQMHHPGMHPAQYHPQQQQMFNNNNQNNKNW